MIAQTNLLPTGGVEEVPTIPGEWFAKFQTGFSPDSIDAVFKVLGGL